jgi:hypothetical protein
MEEFGWPILVVMREHLQNHVSQGYMTTVKLATRRILADPASPAPVVGYVVACSAFYERGFGVPPHRFIRSLLQFYDLELHHLTPSGILHIVVFVILCDAYMGIEPTLICETTSCSATAGLRCGSDGVGLCRNLCSYRARNQPILLSLGLQAVNWMAERVLLPEE